MKLIIDDDKIIDLLETEWGYVGIREDVRRLLIENGIPLEEELEKIKAELNNLDFDFGNYYDETEAILIKINSVLDKHIKENKQ